VPVATNALEGSSRQSVAVAEASAPAPTETVPARRSRSPHFSVVAVLVVGVLITAGLSFGAHVLHNSNENRLLRQRAREVAAVVTSAIPAVETPLASAGVLAEATNGNAADFRQLVQPIAATGQPFASVSLWPRTGATLRPLVVVGVQPELATQPQADIQRLFRQATSDKTVTINDLLGAVDRRLGYAFAGASPSGKFVVYAEAVLPKNRRATIDKNSAFSDLGYALYVGRVADPSSLLASSTGGALLHGRRASATVPFGNSELLVVMTPHAELGGNLLARLWWMLGLLGLVLTLGAASLVARLTRRRKDAEVLAGENAQLYAQQRTVAQTLQHSLLAEAFPEIGGLEFAARYVAGEEGIDIGGDWYDVVRLEQGNILLVVGDVSGRGLEAATMMASLRYSARAYAVEGYSPSVILSKLSGLFNISREGHFATVLCGLLDVSHGRLTLANAGHPEPLLITAAGAEFVATRIGVPVGVRSAAPYEEVEVPFPRDATLLLYTDGAVERRREPLDVGQQRLKNASVGPAGSLDELLAKIAHDVIADTAEDDTALLGIRWQR
jgi:serine phosphatase RsbU (regulator of sigma subunit)